ncbi:ALDOA [Bugula neritina]|uniref:ALDOA n=1 Tax=Bugula neritina TaxID=10212 RepID=A0A7J7KMA6_BUGNE|nr:ALDOA [Bugula neritina]
MAPTVTPPLPDWESVITSAPKSPVTVPIAAWICIAIGAYALVIALILVIRQCVLAKGLCGECRFNCCEGSFSQWCFESCQASCDCKSPSVTGCLDAVCPQRQNVNFADAMMCRCCLDRCCDSDQEGLECGDCKCDMKCDCDNINCLCCELNLAGNNNRPPPPTN